MADDVVIRAEGLGKKYVIGHEAERERYPTLRDVVARGARNAWRKTADMARGRAIVAGDRVEDFWALKDVSFEVKRGEVLGIIGRNGAGKSTLLKILSRITEPTEGRVTINGRVASLLEVGTGFHPELTGRENIYLNGAILGMARAEIKRKFDEIVAFAEVEKFLDTPVKRYSSGMYVRLAFAVAAHLEPEILIVDEVLAVGDAEFQKKCLGKMQDVAGHGRTVLFVSHNISSINRLCPRCILLNGGRIKIDDDVQTVIAQYMVLRPGATAAREWTAGQRPGDEVARLIAVRVRQNGEITASVDIRYPVEIELIYENYKEGAQLMACCAFFDENDVMAFCSVDFRDQEGTPRRPGGLYRSVCRVPGNLYSEGTVRVYVEVSTLGPIYKIHLQAYDCVAFHVVDTGAMGSVRAGWGRPIPGVLRPLCQWTTSGAEKECRYESIKRQTIGRHKQVDRLTQDQMKLNFREATIRILDISPLKILRAAKRGIDWQLRPDGPRRSQLTEAQLLELTLMRNDNRRAKEPFVASAHWQEVIGRFEEIFRREGIQNPEEQDLNLSFSGFTMGDPRLHRYVCWMYMSMLQKRELIEFYSIVCMPLARAGWDLLTTCMISFYRLICSFQLTISTTFMSSTQQ